MKRLLGMALLAMMLVSCGPQGNGSPSSLTPQTGNGAAGETGQIQPSREQIEAVNAEMAEWANGRWTEYAATWSPDAGVFSLSATADSAADADAIKSYCRILDDIVSKHLQEVKVSAAVFLQSGSKIECK